MNETIEGMKLVASELELSVNPDMKRMKKETKTILENSLAKYVFEIIDHVKQGWEIDPNSVPVMFGFAHECGLTRMIEDTSPPKKLTQDSVLRKPGRPAKAK